jgi:hypothetical protein
MVSGFGFGSGQIHIKLAPDWLQRRLLL